jgi:hypothetical protein
MRRVSPVFLAASLMAVTTFFLPDSVGAWGSPGHMTIAAEAYRELPPEYQAQVFEILKAHPDYAEWATNYHPNPVLDLPTTVFMRSSTWPDEIRGSGTEYDHPDWHFIDYPLRAPSFPMEPDARPTNNVLFGIAQCEMVLSDANAGAEKRAAYLSYLIHLVGDEHQPLHCESFYSDTYPNGDRGGNDIYVKPGQVGVRLHGIWDGLLGTVDNRRALWNYAIQLQKEFPRASLTELATNTTPLSWSLESRKLAIQYGYLNGNLQGSTSADTAPALPADYTKNAKAVAERQAALAGYRLADEIQKYLKWNRDLPLLPANTNAAEADVATRIGPADAAKFYDESVVLTGKVSQVTVNPSIVFIRFEQPQDDTPFTAVIFRENTGPFGDLQKFNQHAVEVSGIVTEYRHRPEIVIESTNQVKIVE